MASRSLAVFLAVILGLAAASVVAVETKMSGPPAVPYEDHGACPFECCTYRTWTVKASTDVLTSRRDGDRVAFRLNRGERVEGITGVVVTTKLGKAIVRRSTTIGQREVHVKPGEVIYVLSYLGEGAWKVWVHGQLDEAEIGPKAGPCVGQRPEASACAVRFTEKPQTVWWAKLRDQAGREGWTRQLDHFANIDACG